jgi:HD domain
VEPDELVRWAEAEASRLLSGMGDRWRHVQAVVARAHEAGRVLAEDDRGALIAAAWLHDAGYAPRLAITGFHPLDGARHVRALGQERIAGLVAHHSGAHVEAALRGLTAELAEFRDERSETSAALTYCDMLIGPTGQPVSLEERIADVERRYGTDHVVPRSLRLAQPELARSIDHIEGKLRQLDRA